MTRFTTSSPTERAFMRDKSWQHPSRREHVHGPLIPLETASPAPWWHSAVIVILGMVAVYLCVTRGWGW